MIHKIEYLQSNSEQYNSLIGQRYFLKVENHYVVYYENILKNV